MRLLSIFVVLEMFHFVNSFIWLLLSPSITSILMGDDDNLVHLLVFLLPSSRDPHHAHSYDFPFSMMIVPARQTCCEPKRDGSEEDQASGWTYWARELEARRLKLDSLSLG